MCEPVVRGRQVSFPLEITVLDGQTGRLDLDNASQPSIVR